MSNSNGDQTFLELVKNTDNTINFDASITKDDIIAIAMSEWETDLRNQIKVLDRKFRDLNIEIKAIDKEIENHREAMENDFMKAEVDNLRQCLNVFGWSIELNVSCKFHPERQQATIKIGEDKYNARFSYYQKTVSMSEELCDYFDDLESLNETRDGLSGDLNRLRSELHSAGTKERQARASLAKQVLSSTDAGAHLLEKLESDPLGS